MYDSKDKDIVTKLPHNQKSLMLTFDDGPSRFLPQILDILEDENVKAMFFWQSRLLYSGRPWQRVMDQGHKVGTHTTKHKSLTKLSYEEQYLDLKNSLRKMEDITGNKVSYFRPPFGQYNKDTLKAAKQLELKTVLWRVASIDWELANNPEQIASNVVDNLEDGAIILLHELKQTVVALPELIHIIRKNGYSFSLL